MHALDGTARKFFFDNIAEGSPYLEIVRIITQEYLSDARQLQVKSLLENSRLCTFMKDKGISDVATGLSKLVDHINELSPQCPPHFRSDAHKIDILRKAVAEYQSWSCTPIQSIISLNTYYNGFVTSLHEAILNLRQS